MEYYNTRSFSISRSSLNFSQKSTTVQDLYEVRSETYKLQGGLSSTCLMHVFKHVFNDDLVAGDGLFRGWRGAGGQVQTQTPASFLINIPYTPPVHANPPSIFFSPCCCFGCSVLSVIKKSLLCNAAASLSHELSSFSSIFKNHYLHSLKTLTPLRELFLLPYQYMQKPQSVERKQNEGRCSFQTAKSEFPQKRSNLSKGFRFEICPSTSKVTLEGGNIQLFLERYTCETKNHQSKNPKQNQERTLVTDHEIIGQILIGSPEGKTSMLEGFRF